MVYIWSSCWCDCCLYTRSKCSGSDVVTSSALRGFQTLYSRLRQIHRSLQCRDFRWLRHDHQGTLGQGQNGIWVRKAETLLPQPHHFCWYAQHPLCQHINRQNIYHSQQKILTRWISCLGQWIWSICSVGLSAGYIIWIRWDPPLVPEDCCPISIPAGGVFVQSFYFVLIHTSPVEVEHNHTSAQDKPTYSLCRLPAHFSHIHPVSTSRKTSHQKIFLPHILTHADFKNLFNYQFAFRPSGSTTAALINLLQKISLLLEEHKYVHLIGLDFSKAFDSVRHYTLIEKITPFPIPSNVHNWLVEYLNSRQHCTKYNSVISIKCSK